MQNVNLIVQINNHIMTVILRYCGPFYDAPMHTFMFTEVTALVLELAKTARRLVVELAKIFAQTGFIVVTVKMVQGSSKFLCKWHLAGYPTG